MTSNEADNPSPDAGRWRTVLAQLAMLTAILLIVYAASQIAQRKSLAPVAGGLGLMLLAVPLVWTALKLANVPPPRSMVPRDERDDSVPVHWTPVKFAAVIAAVLVMLVQIEVNGSMFGITALWGLSHHLQFALLILNAALLVWGFSDARFSLPRWRDMPDSIHWELGAVAALTVIAFALRVHNLDAVRAFIDEGNFLIATEQFSTRNGLPLLQPFSSFVAFPNLYPYLQHITGLLADSGLAGLRLPAAIFGTLTIPALYLLGRALFDRRVAFIGAALLATLPVHLQWSRLGLNNAADGLFAILMMALLVRGARRGGAWHFAAAGVCLGLTQYFYEAGRLFFPVLAGVWLVYMRWTVWGGLSRRYLAVFFASAFIMALPIYTTLAAMDYPFAIRYAVTRTGDSLWTGGLPALVQGLAARLGETILLFIHAPEDILFYGGDYPYFNVWLLPLLPLGLAVLLWRWRTGQAALLLLWIFGMVAAITFLVDGANSARALNMFPALMLACAVGIVEVSNLLVNGRRRVLLAVLSAAVLTIGALDVAYYFGVYTERFTSQHYGEQPEQEIAFHARILPEGMRAYYITTRFVRQRDLGLFLRSYRPGATLEVYDGEALDEFISGVPFSENLIFYLRDDDTHALHRLMQRFELRGPLRWPNLYAPPGIEFVAYFAAADLQVEGTR